MRGLCLCGKLLQLKVKVLVIAAFQISFVFLFLSITAREIGVHICGLIAELINTKLVRYQKQKFFTIILNLIFKIN